MRFLTSVRLSASGAAQRSGHSHVHMGEEQSTYKAESSVTHALANFRALEDAMSSIDLFDEERQMAETVLDILETVAVQLDSGEPIPNAILGDVVDFLRELEDAAYDIGEAGEGRPYHSRFVAQDQTRHVLVRNMQAALESLDRGEAGAVGAFVISAREYLRASRETMRVDDADVPTATAAVPATAGRSSPGRKHDQTPQRRVAVQRFNRLFKLFKNTQRTGASSPARVPAPDGRNRAN
jgi:hemerythrin-like domain-containing protein